MDLDDGDGDIKNVWDLEVGEKVRSAEEDIKHCSHVEVSNFIIS